MEYSEHGDFHNLLNKREKLSERESKCFFN